MDIVLLGQIGILASQRRGESSTIVTIEVLANFLAWILLEAREESGRVHVSERGIVTSPAAMAIRADVTLLRKFWIGSRELFIEAKLGVVFGPAQNSLSPEPRVERDVECSEIEARPTAVEEERVGDAPVVLLG